MNAVDLTEKKYIKWIVPKSGHSYDGYEELTEVLNDSIGVSVPSEAYAVILCTRLEAKVDDNTLKGDVKHQSPRIWIGETISIVEAQRRARNKMMKRSLKSAQKFGAQSVVWHERTQTFQEYGEFLTIETSVVKPGEKIVWNNFVKQVTEPMAQPT